MGDVDQASDGFCSQRNFMIEHHLGMHYLHKFINYRVIIIIDATMPAAIVLINTEIGTESEVMSALVKIDGVREIYEVYGMYDIVVKVEADTHEALRELVINKIRRIPQVRGTTTMIVIEERAV